MRMRSLLGPALGLALAAVLSMPSAEAAETPIRLGGLATSLTGIAVETMIHQGFDKRHGVAVTYHTYPTLDAVFTAIRGEAVDVGSGGWTAIAQFRSKGIPLVMFFPIARGGSLDVLVPKASPIHSLADLKNKKIGTYAGAAGTGTVLLRVLTKNYFGYDPATTGKLQYAGPGLLPTLLDKGELDAVLEFDPIAAKMLASGKYRSVANLPDIYKDKVGQDFLWIGFSTNDTFVKQHPEALKGFSAAWIDAVKYVRAHPAVYDAYVKKMGFDEKTATLLRKRVDADYVIDWNDQSIAAMKNFATFARKIMGPGYLDHFDRAAFTTAFAPKP